MEKFTRRNFMKTAAVMSTFPLVVEASKQKKEVPTLKIIHATDTHMDMANEVSVKYMELMVNHINEHYKDLDFVVFGGDNFNNNAEGNKDAKLFNEIISKLHCPTLLVRGNKESSPKPEDGVNANDFAKMFFNREGMTVEGRDWVITKKGCQILGLDSSIEGKNNGVYTKETIAFAKKVLDTGLPTVIVNHHPYINYWKGTEPEDIQKYVLGNSEEVQRELFSYKNLILTLSGHKHIDDINKIGHVNIIATRGYKRPLDIGRYPMRYVEVKGFNMNEKMIYTS